MPCNPALASTRALLPGASVTPGGTQFVVRFDESVQNEPYSGRVYVALEREDGREPRAGMSAWFDASPLYALDVEALAPGQPIAFDARALFHPTPLAELAPGTWFAQAVARKNLDAARPGTGAGDLHSDVVRFEVGPEEHTPLELLLNTVVEERPFVETARVKLFELVSARLSAFHGRPIVMRAGVVLPDGWAEDEERRHPVIYRIPGFGGTHRSARALGAQIDKLAPEQPMRRVLQVVLDPTCFRGHHVFADSRNNGPWGSALVEELIPALEARYRGALDPDVRFLTGVSSGGWSSLWLQIHWPETFGACYSHVPDPVDFRDFQRIDLYRAGESMYVDAAGERRSIARKRGEVELLYQEFVARETVLGPGGQIHSFEASFSPRGADGTPRLVFDRASGLVDREVVRAWEAYDIRLLLERNWRELGPRLAGKLHIYAGEVDTYFLEGAVRRLCATLAKLGSDAVCKVVPGMAHTTHKPGAEEMVRELMERWGAR